MKYDIVKAYIQNPNFLKHIGYALSFIFIAIPGTIGVFDGVPLGNLTELVALYILISCIMLFPRPDFPLGSRTGIVALLIIIAGSAGLKLWIGTISLPHGLVASYYAPESEIPERSTEFKNTGSGTRIDPEVNFAKIAYSTTVRPFPLWFFNDNTRFNRSTEETNASIPFRAMWKGYIYIPRSAPAIRIEARSGTATAMIGDKPSKDGLIAFSPTADREDVMPIAVEYAAHGTPHAKISLSWENGEGMRSVLFPERHASAEIIRDAWLAAANGALALGASAAMIALLFAGISARSWKRWLVSHDGALALAWILASCLAAYGLMQIAPSNYANFLAPEGDSLTYETFARHLQFTGDFAMRAFEHEAYYWQILYYHILAIAHEMFGEALFPLFFMQALSIIVAGYAAAYATASISGIRDWRMIPAFALVAGNPLLTQGASALYPGGALLVTLTILFLMKARSAFREARAGMWQAVLVGGGIACSLAVLMRTDIAAWLPVIVIWIAISFPRERIAAYAAFILPFIIVLSPFVARNMLVAGQFRLVSQSSSTANFMLGTPLPANHAPDNSRPEGILRKTGFLFDERANKTLNWIAGNPRNYARLLMKKAAVLGGFRPFDATIAILYGLGAAGALLGFIFRPDLRLPISLIAGGIFAQLGGLAIMSVAFMRYSAPLVPPLAILAAMTLYLPWKKT